MTKSKYQVYGQAFIPKTDSHWNAKKYDEANKVFRKDSKAAIAKVDKALSQSSKSLGSFRLGG